MTYVYINVNLIEFHIYHKYIKHELLKLILYRS